MFILILYVYKVCYCTKQNHIVLTFFENKQVGKLFVLKTNSFFCLLSNKGDTSVFLFVSSPKNPGVR